VAKQKTVHPTVAATRAAEDRRSGRRAWRGETQERVRERRAPPRDDFREAINSGEVLIEDLPVSHKKHDVLTTATEQAWTEAGPTDIDAARAREQDHPFVAPSDAVARDRGMPTDSSFSTFEAELRAAARADYTRAVNDLVASGMKRQEAEAEAAREIRAVRARPLPGIRRGPTQDLVEGAEVPELMSDAKDDARITPGVAVRRELPSELPEDGPASILRDADEPTMRELDGGVRRQVPAPE